MGRYISVLWQGRPERRSESMIGLGFFLFLVAIVQIADLTLTPSTYYDSLAKPSYAPPSWVFSPVWTTLWVLTGAAAWLAWREAGLKGAQVAFAFWGLHLVGNVAWTVIFFQLRSLDLAAFQICTLTAVVVGAVVGFWQVRPLAGALLIPLLGWLVFASATTLDIARMN